MRGIEEARVGPWLVEHVEGAVAPFEYRLIAGGRSNLTFAVTGADGAQFVLRRPPLSHVLASAHDMGREHRLISSVGKAGTVPVPRALGLCTDGSVNGAPFYVMELVAGAVLDGPDKAALLPLELRRPASEHLIDVLAEIHAIDIDAVGLGDLSRRGGYLDRQLRRWTKQWEASKTRELPLIEEVGQALRDRMPEEREVVIAHGDYRFGNCITDVEHARIAAVLDWELCTLGDPLADLGYLACYWSDPGSGTLNRSDPSGAEGFPTLDDLLERYARRTGRDVDNIDYYVAFQHWRLAVISEGVRARYAQGAMGEDQTAELEDMPDSVAMMAAAAEAAVQRLG
jgi:aminoglycoside phosphotransferase (APT) family kinase protein